MKKIITAMGNNKLAEEIQKTNIFDVISRDISYKEGILEFLEEMSDVDILIISEILDGEMEFKDLIKEILRKNENIEIIVFVEEKNPEIQNFLFSNGIYKIYQNNEIDLETFINSISNNLTVTADYEFINNELEKIHNEMQIKVNDRRYSFESFNANGKAIVLYGTYNSGKSTLACMFAKEYAKQGKKTLIIDFDTYNGSINTLLNIPKYKKTEIAFNIENQIINISKNLDALCAIDLLFNNDNTIDYINLEDMIQNFKIHYDIIIIDTSSNYKYKYLPRILNSADGIIFFVVPSIVELKKTLNLLEIILYDFKIKKEKLQIIFNKINSGSVDETLAKKMFKDIKITGNIKYDEKIEKNVMSKNQNSLSNINEIIGE